ncbi:lymphotoxin beta receptor inhibitor-like isoform X2 [Cherax quadricarinatus]|uniref:lymphotoxin beta receptor inhibitor-like isoform X2 n=1 Tax=Cherax quadricarinatus TaxID=27406 RepID=UPI00387E39C0
MTWVLVRDSSASLMLFLLMLLAAAVNTQDTIQDSQNHELHGQVQGQGEEQHIQAQVHGQGQVQEQIQEQQGQGHVHGQEQEQQGQVQMGQGQEEQEQERERQIDDEAKKQEESHKDVHLAEHLQSEGHLNLESMSTPEKRYHLFLAHDYDDDYLLDGIELIQSLVHGRARLPLTEEELSAKIDHLLQQFDGDQDGKLSFPEYMKSFI